MTTGEATQTLRKMYDDRMRSGQAWAAIVLICIKYSDELCDLSFSDVLEQEGMSTNYDNYSSLGRKLAGYVSVVRDFP